MRRLQIVFLLCALLLFCTSCGQEAAPSEATASPDTYLTSELSSIPVETRSPEGVTHIAIPHFEGDPYAPVIEELYAQYARYETAEVALTTQKYAFYDIDGNGIDELLISTQFPRWGGIDIPNGQNSALYQTAETWGRIYTISDGKLTEAPTNESLFWDSFDALGGRIIFTNGVVCEYGGTPEHTSYIYHHFENGEVQFLKGLSNSDVPKNPDDPDDLEDTFWKFENEKDPFDKEQITEEEFERMKAEIEGGAEVVELDWHPIIEYGK